VHRTRRQAISFVIGDRGEQLFRLYENTRHEQYSSNWIHGVESANAAVIWFLVSTDVTCRRHHLSISLSYADAFLIRRFGRAF
jgi:sulfate adenylyltransferase subunit 1 (EFTu-like GTPase family)